MKNLKLGIIKERKTPPDERVPLNPSQCKEILNQYPNVSLKVETSDIRRYKDTDYTNEGVDIVSDVNDADILIGVKEVPKEALIPNKRYFFFSHTIKEQPYNRDLLQTILNKNIELIDWETLTAKNGKRLIGFGRYAGIVGAYNAFLAWGKRYHTFNLKKAIECEDRVELEQELKKVTLPALKIALTGTGRVAHGAIEILNELGIKKVSKHDFLNQDFDYPVFTQLEVNEYFSHDGKNDFDKKIAYTKPETLKSDFMKYAAVSDMYIACHYWDSESPFIFTREDAKSKDFKIKLVADISCDIDGPVASTIRPSTIANPIYGYNPVTEKEDDFDKDGVITVMAVDNLPCELPKDASTDFGSEFMKHILPALAGDDADTIIERATMTRDGKLTEKYSYLQNFVDGK